MTRPRLLLVLVLPLLLGGCATGVALRGQKNALAFKPGFGPHEVRVAEKLVLHDAARDQDVPVRVYYPATGGPYPVIVFSHGGGDNLEAAALNARHWASHGYVSIHPNHYPNLVPFMSHSIVRTVYEIHLRRSEGPEAWENRIGDIQCVLDSFDRLAELEPALSGKLDHEHIGIAGHSYGAYTAMLVAGATLTDPKTGTEYDYALSGIDAALILSGHGVDKHGLTAESWAQTEIPMMAVSGTKDTGIGGDKGRDWRMQPVALSPPGDKYFVWMKGARHISFVRPLSDPGPGWSPPDRPRRKDDYILFTHIASIAFWDATLKDNPQAKAYLQSEKLERFSAGTVELVAR